MPEDVALQKIAFCLCKQWTLYSLTPLYKFSYINFKEHSKHLSTLIAAEKLKGLAVEEEEDFNIEIFSLYFLGMKETQRDPETFLV